MKKNMIIWDWNGTLLDDVDLCVEAINMLLARESLPLLTGKEEYQRVFQFPIRAYYEAVGSQNVLLMCWRMIIWNIISRAVYRVHFMNMRKLHCIIFMKKVMNRSCYRHLDVIFC